METVNTSMLDMSENTKKSHKTSSGNKREKNGSVRKEMKLHEYKSTDESTNSKSSNPRKKKKWELTSEVRQQLANIPGVLGYIEHLEKCIDIQARRIEKWKSKLKKGRMAKAKSTQTLLSDFLPQQNLKVEAKKQTKDAPTAPKSITEEIKQAAEEFVLSSGFVYEETSGLYYDYNTGYYYNAEYGLYYDGNSGTYMKYNHETETYEFHSQVSKPNQEVASNKLLRPKRKMQKTPKKKGAKRAKTAGRGPDGADVEEGECSDSGGGSGSSDERETDGSDITKQWPPCMRIIIESSENPKIKQGSLHIVTCDGGTLGREGDHSILLPDISVSKHHLKFTFEKKSSKYFVTDLGSRNGTLLNAKRMSSSKQESEALEISHGSKLQIGTTVLLCHIHDGSHTCGHCEPGLVQANEKEAATLDKVSMADRHKNELRKLKKQCGFFADDNSVKLASGYTDRAQKRRDTVGSQNPNEKTQMASVDESIPMENKGFKLLSKMGWKEGQSLGKTGEGITEPIHLVSNKGKTGIGAESTAAVEVKVGNTAKEIIWKKAQERFEKLPNINVEVPEDHTED